MSAYLGSAGASSFDEDLILVERFLSGDEQAFGTLYERYYDKVMAISRGILIEHEEAADAVQEIFTLVYRHLGRFDRRSRFSTWLFRIAVNRSIQHARSTKHRAKNVPLDEALTQAEITEPNITDGDPLVARVMLQLQPQDRALLTLFYWEELSLNEIAESIGCSVNAAKTRLFRARERFRVLYERENA